jgi:hypothetical protein
MYAFQHTGAVWNQKSNYGDIGGYTIVQSKEEGEKLTKRLTGFYVDKSSLKDGKLYIWTPCNDVHDGKEVAASVQRIRDALNPAPRFRDQPGCSR